MLAKGTTAKPSKVKMQKSNGQKSVEQVVKALKLKAQATPNVMSLRLGVKKYALPFEARLLKSNEYVFVHVPPSAQLFKIGKDGLTEVKTAAEAREATASFRQTRKRGGRRGGASGSGFELPESLLSELKKLPAGMKLAYDGGNAKVFKARKRAAAAKAAASKK